MAREFYTGYSEKEILVIRLSLCGRQNERVRYLPFGAAGFEIRNEQDKAMAAVSLIDNGVVYLGQVEGSEKLLMANICTALLLQTNIAE